MKESLLKKESIMSRPLWFVDLVKKSFPSRFLMAKMSNLPGFKQVIDMSLFAGDDIIYLPKDKVIQINQPIERPSDVMLPSAVVEHFIEESSHHWIMNYCICRESSGCEDYPRDFGCLFLGEAVQKINPELGRRVEKAEALDHLQRSQEAGLVNLIGRNKLDTVWLGANPGHKLLTICHCCPCCCLWKVLPTIAPSIGDKVTKMPGVVLTVTEACKGCKLCIRNVCFVDAIQMDGKTAIIDQAQCRGCGRCVEICPLDAIELTITDEAFMDRAIERISPLVDLS